MHLSDTENRDGPWTVLSARTQQKSLLTRLPHRQQSGSSSSKKKLHHIEAARKKCMKRWMIECKYLCVSAMWIRCPATSHRCTKIFSYFAGCRKGANERSLFLPCMHECVFYIFQYLSWLPGGDRGGEGDKVRPAHHIERASKQDLSKWRILAFFLSTHSQLVSKNGFECPGAFCLLLSL